MTTATETQKPRPTLKMEFVDGKQVFIIPAKTLEKFADVRNYCQAIDALLAKVK